MFQEGEDLSWLDSVQLVVMEVHPGNRAHFGLKVGTQPPAAGQAGAPRQEGLVPALTAAKRGAVCSQLRRWAGSAGHTQMQ